MQLSCLGLVCAWACLPDRHMCPCLGSRTFCSHSLRKLKVDTRCKIVLGSRHVHIDISVPLCNHCHSPGTRVLIAPRDAEGRSPVTWHEALIQWVCLQEGTCLAVLQKIEQSYAGRKKWADENIAHWDAHVRGVVKQSTSAIREYGQVLQEIVTKNAEQLQDGGAAGADGCVRAADGTVLGKSEYLQTQAHGRVEQLEMCKRLLARCDSIEQLSQ